jgi:hypothetical protein
MQFCLLLVYRLNCVEGTTPAFFFGGISHLGRENSPLDLPLNKTATAGCEVGQYALAETYDKGVYGIPKNPIPSGECGQRLDGWFQEKHWLNGWRLVWRRPLDNIESQFASLIKHDGYG